MQALPAGDAEGANEMSYSMSFLRQFCRIFQDQAGTTRIFFPDDKVRPGRIFVFCFLNIKYRSDTKRCRKINQ